MGGRSEAWSRSSWKFSFHFGAKLLCLACLCLSKLIRVEGLDCPAPEGELLVREDFADGVFFAKDASAISYIDRFIYRPHHYRMAG